MARRGERRAFRVTASAALVFLALFVWASPAFAHAEVVAASPEPGTGLSQAPGVVELKFSERLNGELSRIRVVDRTGRDVGTGSTRLVVGDATAMRRKLGFLRLGVYTVDWTSVSTLDGHVLKGSYQFGVGTSPAGDETVHSGPIASEGLIGLIGGFAAFVGLGLWFGSVMLGPAATGAGLPASRRALLSRLSPAVAFVGAGLSILSSAQVATGSWLRVDDVVLTSASGRYRLIVLVAAGAGMLLAPSDRSRWRVLTAVLVSVGIVAQAASGHAAATTNPFWATASLAAHLAAVGVWLFALAAAALAISRFVNVLAALSLFAIGAAITVAVTGLVNTIFELNSVAELTSTGYGQVITFKIAALAVMGAFGYAHHIWRQRPNTASEVRRALHSELTAAVVALVLAAILVGFPNPPREVARAEAAAATSDQSLGSRPAVSVAAASGQFIVGLTVLPPRPGPVQFRLLIIGGGPSDALRDARVIATGPNGARHVFVLPSCGLGCFRGPGRVATLGTWRLDARVTSNRGRINIVAVLPFPTPDASHILVHALTVMSRLRSVQMDETLLHDATKRAQSAVYRFVAPDRFAYAVDGGAAQIQIGTRQYRRDSPHGGWVAQPSAPGDIAPHWPADYFHAVWEHAAAVRLIGTDTVDGIPTQVVAFGRRDIHAWFRLWIGPDGIVRREQMRAEGHLMDHRYRDFGGPIVIVAPQT